MRPDRVLARALLLAALVGTAELAPPAAGPAAAQAVDPEARYEPVDRVLTLIPPPGVVPTVRELKDPPRLVAEWPATWGTTPRGLLYGAGLVQRFTVEIVGTSTRVTLYFRAPIDGQWTLSANGPRTQIKLLPNDYDADYVRPIPKRTPRPAPMPMARITPKPVFPIAPTPRPLPGMAPVRPLPPEPSWRPDDRLPVPAPYGSPLVAVPEPSLPPTPPPPVPATPAPVPATPVPTPVATPVPAPSVAPTAAPTPEPLIPPVTPVDRPVYGSQVWVGAEPPVAYSEVYPAGGSDTSLPFGLGGGFGWDHMLSENVGLAIGGRTAGFVITDEAASTRGFEVKHRRDDFELGAGVRGRMAFGGGLEGMLQPGLLVRAARASTTHAAITGGVAGAAAEVDTTDYLSANWLAYGGAVRGGLGWRAGGPFALSAFGEFRYLANGSVFTPAVPAFFPMWGWRAGAEAKLDFEGWGLGLGYAQGHDEHGGTTAADKLTQDGGMPFLRGYWLY